MWGAMPEAGASHRYARLPDCSRAVSTNWPASICLAVDVAGEHRCLCCPHCCPQEADAEVTAFHRIVGPAGIRTAVACPISVGECPDNVFHALVRVVLRGAYFAAGRPASFGSILFGPLAPARDAGNAGSMAGLAAAPAAARGLCVDVGPAVTAGVLATMAAVDVVHTAAAEERAAAATGESGAAAGEPAAPAAAAAAPLAPAAVEIVSQLQGPAAWRCRSCSCAAGAPSLDCPCRCVRC